MGKGFRRFLKLDRYDYRKAFQELLDLYWAHRKHKSMDTWYTEQMVRNEMEHILRRCKKKWWHL